jgi:hypothetical protein
MTQAEPLLCYMNESNVFILANELELVRVAKHTAIDGEKVNLYKLGNPASEKLVILPPYGISYVLVSKLARALSERFYVLSWESKGCPDNAVAMSTDDLQLDTQSANFENIIKQEGFEDFHFVGWCQASQLLVHTLAKTELKPRTISWVAPAGLGCSLVSSEFERCALPVYLEIERQGVVQAEKLARILDKYRDEPITDDIAAEKLTMLHLSDAEMTHRFSKYMKAYEDNKTIAKDLLDTVLNMHKALVIHCKDDTYSHYSEAVQLDKQYQSIELSLLPKGGHLQLFNDPDVLVKLIHEYIDRESASVMDKVAEV